jgi:hypothetical protein
LRGDLRGSRTPIDEAAVYVYWSNDGPPIGPLQPVNVRIAKSRYGGGDEEIKLVVNKSYGSFHEEEGA